MIEPDHSATVHETKFMFLYRKLDLNKQMAQQHESIHDQLNEEYEELWSNPRVILEQLEEYFDDTFDAKCFLSDIFMVTLCQRYVYACII